MVSIFCFALLALDQWRPDLQNPRVETTLEESAYEALLNKTTFGNVTMLSKYTIVLVMNLNFVLTFLLLSKKYLSYSTYGVYVSSFVFYSLHLVMFSGVFPGLPLLNVILHSMWLSLLSDEMKLSSGLNKLSEARYHYKSA
jgi:hypothetical protein